MSDVPVKITPFPACIVSPVCLYSNSNSTVYADPADRPWLCALISSRYLAKYSHASAGLENRSHRACDRPGEGGGGGRTRAGGSETGERAVGREDAARTGHGRLSAGPRRAQARASRRGTAAASSASAAAACKRCGPRRPPSSPPTSLSCELGRRKNKVQLRAEEQGPV